MKDRKRYRLQLNLIAIGLPESAISKHQDDCPCWYAAHAKSLTESKRHIRPHPIIPSPCARRGEGAAEQPQKVSNIVDTTRTRVHGDDGKNGKRFLAAIRFGMTISLRDEKSHRKNAGDSCRCKIAYGQYKIDIATITKST